MQQVEVEEGRRILFMFLGRWPVTVSEAVTRETKRIRTTELTFGPYGSWADWFKEELPSFKRRENTRQGEQESASDGCASEII